MRFLLLAICLVGLCAGFGGEAYALKVSPFKAHLIPAGRDVTSVFRVENHLSEPVAVQMGVMTWDIEPDGREVNKAADDLFVVFPSQMILKPGERRAVRVQWLGEQDVEHERPFRFVAEQVPIALKQTPKGRSGLSFMVRFMAALYITPHKAKSDIQVKRIERLGNKMRVYLANQGTGHSLVREPELKIILANEKSLILKEEDLLPIAGENIHAGKVRYFDLPMPRGVREDILRGEIAYKKGF